MALSNRIRELREARGWSGRELARRAGVDAGGLQKVEAGQRQLTQQWMRTLGEAFGLPPSAVLPDEDVEARLDEAERHLVAIYRSLPAALADQCMRIAEVYEAETADDIEPTTSAAA